MNTLALPQLVIVEPVKCGIELVLDWLDVASIRRPRLNARARRAQCLARVAASSHNQQDDKRETV